MLWPPWYSTTNNIANFDPRFYDPAQAAIINPAPGGSPAAAATTASSWRGTASGGGERPRGRERSPVQALFRGEPRGFSKTHYNVFEPRIGMSYPLNERRSCVPAPASSTTVSC